MLTDADSSKYESLRPVYALNILDEQYFEDTIPLRIFQFHDPKRGLTLEPSYLNIGYFEPGKAKSGDALTDHQAFWRDHFLGHHISAKAPNYIREAAELLEYVNMTKEERDMIDWAERVQEDYKCDILYAKHEGRAEGRDEEAVKAKAELLKSAGKLKTKGLSTADIVDALGLTEQEVIGA
jgi:hypothetical protein